jgi:hypothetical protein
MLNERQERRFERNVFIVWIAWAISMFLPAAVVRGLPVGPIAVPGWQAAAISVLHPEQIDRGAFRFVFRLMAFTNVVVAFSPATLVTRRRAVQNAFMFLAVGAACVDALGLVALVSVLSCGYFVWLACFVALALTLSRDRGAARPF